MTVRQAIKEFSKLLKEADIEGPEIEAALILAFALRKDRFWLHLNPDHEIEQAAAQNALEMVKKRARGEPLAYITGEKEFWSLPFYVTSDTLIPRPETELLIERTVELAGHFPEPHLRIADLGTGSGIIAVTLAKELEDVFIVALDISLKALRIAKKNSERHGVGKKIAFVVSDWFSALRPCSDSGACLDIIVANPPYVAASQAQTLQKEVRDFEPQKALFAGIKGTEALEKIIMDAPKYLGSNGWLLCEIGWDQGEAVKKFAANQGCYQHISVIQDLAGLDRLIEAQKKG